MIWRRQEGTTKNLTLDIWKDIPKMEANAKQVKDVKKALALEVQSSIDDFRDKLVELQHQEGEFTKAMLEVQAQSNELSTIEEQLNNFDRELSVVRASTDQIQKRLNDVKIEQSLPSEQDDLFTQRKLRLLPFLFHQIRRELSKKGLTIFVAIFILVPIL